MSKIHLSITGKIFLLTAATILLITAAASLLINRRMSAALHHEIEEKVESLAAHLVEESARDLLTGDKIALTQRLEELTGNSEDIEYSYVLSTDGKVLAHSFGTTFPEELLKVNSLPPGRNRSIVAFRSKGALLHDMTRPILDGKLGNLHLGFSHTAAAARIRQLLSELSMIMALAGLLLIAATVWLGRILSSALSPMREASREISRGRLNHRIQASNSPEIAELHRDFNAMAEQLEKMIGERDLALGKLRENEALQKTLLDNLDFGIALISTGQEILTANPAMGKIFNQRPEELPGKKCHEILRDAESPCDDCPGQEVMAGKKPRTARHRIHPVGGQPVTLRIKAFPVYFDNGSLRGFVDVVEDISRLEQYEHDQRKKMNLDSISILAGGIAHDFNNILTVILGYIDLCRAAADQASPSHEMLNQAHKSCVDAKQLTGRLLTFARGDNVIREELDLADFLEKECRFIMSGSPVKCEIITPPEPLWKIKFSKSQLSQVIRNLLFNAREAMSGGGLVVIRIDNLLIGKDSTLPLGPGPHIRVKISDRGPGIDPRIVERIFDPYFTTKPMGSTKGAGMGLAICHSIITKNLGHIAVESRPGQGTSIIFYLPALQPPSRQAVNQVEPVKTAKTGRTGKGRVLLLEDEENVGTLAVKLLEHLNFEAAITSRGEETVRRYSEALAASRPFDLVVLDLTIRDGMGGRETIKILREMDPRIKAVVASGYHQDPVMNHFQDHGFLDRLPKPYTLESLEELLSRLFP